VLELRPITLRDANDFVQSFHRHNGRTSRDGGKFAISLIQDGELAAVAIVGNPLSATYMDGVTAEVLRLCVRDEAERNACSKLYAACWRAWRAMGGQRLITYTLKTESGDSLRGAGWKVIGQTKAVAPGWRKNDQLNSLRTWSPVMGQEKLRWEKSDHEQP